MQDQGWRTVVIENQAELCLNNGFLLVKNEQGEHGFPLSQIQTLMVVTQHSSLTVPLLAELCRRHVNVIICDEKKNPLCCAAVPLSEHSTASGCILLQTKWEPEDLHRVWQRVVQEKIKNQCGVLAELIKPVPDVMAEYYATIQPNDSTNREGQAARVYFSSLFGNHFIRHTTDNINGALDYGYAILRSAMGRVLSLHGYHPAIGIKHRSATNPYNLACDLMEPFRPAVDRIVARHGDISLDWPYRKELIAILQTEIHYGEQRLSLHDAMDCFARDVLRAIGDVKYPIGEVRCYE